MAPAGVVLVVGVAIGMAVFDKGPDNRSKNTAPTALPGSTLPMPQARSVDGTTRPPPGLAPPGKVWSAEHGHWHDAAGAAGQTTATAANTGPIPQPPGPVPEGKVWSPEHGHWHDAPGASTTTVAPAVASTENVNSATTDPNLTPQPPGPVPPGQVWSPEHGHWHDLGPVAPTEATENERAPEEAESASVRLPE